MIRTFIFFTFLWLYQVLVLPFLIAALIAEKCGNFRLSRRIANPISLNWARWLVRISGARVTVVGKVDVPDDQPVMVVSNHQGDFDIPLLMVHLGRPVGFIAKRSLGKIPSIGSWMRLSGCLFLERESPRQAVLLVRQAIESLHTGDSLVIFPEGTRSGTSEMQEFKRGSLSIGPKAGVPILPVTIDGSWQLKRPGNLWVRGADVTITIGATIPTAEMPRDEQKELAGRVETIIRAAKSD